MTHKTAIWCAKHYHNSFRRALFEERISKLMRVEIRAKAKNLKKQGLELSKIFNILKLEYPNVYLVDLYALICQNNVKDGNKEDSFLYEPIKKQIF